MKGPAFIVIVVFLTICGGLIYAQRHWHDGIHNEAIAEARRASAAAGLSAEAVDFQWEYSGCPPESQALFAEWNRRLVDAEVSISRAEDLLHGDPRILALISATSDQRGIIHQKKMQCLETQSRFLSKTGSGR
jgi:hypothetical protein